MDWGSLFTPRHNLFVCFSYLLKDSVLVIPEESYSPKLLNPKALDKASDFISQCGSRGFHIEYVSALVLSRVSEFHFQLQEAPKCLVASLQTCL